MSLSVHTEAVVVPEAAVVAKVNIEAAGEDPTTNFEIKKTLRNGIEIEIGALPKRKTT